MKLLVIPSYLLAVAVLTKSSAVGPVSYGYGIPLTSDHPSVTIPVDTPVVHSVTAVTTPVVQKTQYHAQDELGQASYGHSEPLQAHSAVQDFSGNKAGSYSYVAPDGQIISANYVADSLGYRVASNALPTGPVLLPVAPADTPEVIAARLAHLKEYAVVKSRGRRSVALTAPYVYSTPLAAVHPVLRSATLTTVVNTPGHAVSYRVN